jgi:hypothetical protein
LLHAARKRGLIDSVPEFEWRKTTLADRHLRGPFGFCTADGQMFLVEGEGAAALSQGSAKFSTENDNAA